MRFESNQGGAKANKKTYDDATLILWTSFTLAINCPTGLHLRPIASATSSEASAHSQLWSWSTRHRALGPVGPVGPTSCDLKVIAWLCQNWYLDLHCCIDLSSCYMNFNTILQKKPSWFWSSLKIVLLLLKVPTLKNSIKFELETQQCIWSVVLSAMFYDRITWAFFFITLHHFGGTSRTDLVASRLRVKASTSPGFESLATCGRALGPLAPILPLGGNNCKDIFKQV